MLHPRELGKGFWEAEAEGRWWDTAACDDMERVVKIPTSPSAHQSSDSGGPAWPVDPGLGISFVATLEVRTGLVTCHQDRT